MFLANEFLSSCSTKLLPLWLCKKKVYFIDVHQYHTIQCVEESMKIYHRKEAVNFSLQTPTINLKLRGPCRAREKKKKTFSLMRKVRDAKGHSIWNGLLSTNMEMELREKDKSRWAVAFIRSESVSNVLVKYSWLRWRHWSRGWCTVEK